MSSSDGSSQKAKTITSPIEALTQNKGQESAPAKKFQRPEFGLRAAAQESPKPTHEAVQLFDARAHQQQEDNRNRIEELLSAIRAEVSAARAESSVLTNKLTQIEKAASQPAPVKIGIYHIEYYALLLEHARNIRTQLHAAMWNKIHATRQATKRGMIFSASHKATTNTEVI